MDVDSFVETVEQSVKEFEPGVVLPAIDVLRVDIGDGFLEPIKDVAGGACFSSSGWPGEEGGFCAVAVGEWAESARQGVEFVVAMSNVAWNVFRFEDAGICNHSLGGQRSGV